MATYKLISSLLILCILTTSVLAYASAISIEKGWNLVHVGDITKTYGDNVRFVTWFDPIEKKYYQVFPKDEVSDHLRTYSPEQRRKLSNTASWVYSTRSENFDLDLNDIAPTDRTYLYQGWNLVVLSEGMIDENDLEMRSWFGDCTVSSVYIWTADENQWAQIFDGDDFKVASFGPTMFGRAIAVKVQSDCRLGSQEFTPPPIPN